MSCLRRVDWGTTALCLSEPCACCLRCTSACFCPRPRGNLYQSSQVNSTSSTSKARTEVWNPCNKPSISWAKCVIPRPCRWTFSPETICPPFASLWPNLPQLEGVAQLHRNADTAEKNIACLKLLYLECFLSLWFAHYSLLLFVTDSCVGKVTKTPCDFNSVAGNIKPWAQEMVYFYFKRHS